MSREMNKFYKKLSKSMEKDFVDMSFDGDKIVLPEDAKGDIELPKGYSIVDGIVFKGTEEIGHVEYTKSEPLEEIKTNEEELESEEEIEDDYDFDFDEEEEEEEEVKKASHVPKTSILDNFKSVKKDDEEEEEEEIEDDYDFDFDESESEEETESKEIEDDHDLADSTEETNEEEVVENKEQENVKVENLTDDEIKSSKTVVIDNEKETKEEDIEIDSEVVNEEKSISESTNVSEIAQAIANINPDVQIALGDPENDPECNSRIFSSVPVDKLDLPEGFYYNEKNGVTNKHNTKSGAYCGFRVEDIKNADESKLLLLSPENEVEEIEEVVEKRHPVKRFFQKIAYAVTRFFKKGKKIKQANQEELDEEEIELDEEELTDEDLDKKSKEKIENSDNIIEEKMEGLEARNEDLLKAASIISEQKKLLEEENDLLNKELERVRKENEALRNQLKALGVDVKPAVVNPVVEPGNTESDTIEPDTKGAIDTDTTVVNPVSSTNTDEPRKFEFTSVEDTRAKFEEYDRPEREFAEVESQMNYYEDFLNNHELSHSDDQEMRQRMMDKLTALKTKYTELKAKRDDKEASEDLRSEKLAYYTQTAKGIDKAIDRINKERKFRILQAELEGKTIVNLGLAEERKIDAKKAELEALKAECIARKNAEMKYYNDIAARMTLALKR